MNHWAAMLAALPSLGQRLIARTHRVSLPRGCTPDLRVQRLRRALCPAASVRAAYAALDAETRAALDTLRATRGGLPPDEVARRFGPIRSWTQLAHDPQPRSVAERLVLMGWLIRRPAAHRHPERLLLPPELRRALPTALAIPTLGPAPAPAAPAALRAATSILLASAERPLAVRADGRPRAATARALAARLPDLPADEARALLGFITPLLADLGLVATATGHLTPAPAARTFLAAAPHEQLRRLRDAWTSAPRPDTWFGPARLSDAGIDWPLLRRRLLAWAEALPPDALLDPNGIYDHLAAALGPLADARTHGFRRIDRAPWQPHRAASILDAALRGPLAWLGVVAWAEQLDAAPALFRPAAPISSDPPPWRSHDDGTIQLPSIGCGAAALTLAAHARFAGADATHLRYRLGPEELARATRRGTPASALRALLEANAGPLPPAWQARLTPPPAIRALGTVVLLADEPAVLRRAAASRSVRRYIQARPARGVALVEPHHLRPLARALARQQVAVAGLDQLAPPAPAAPPLDLAPGDCAALLLACAVASRSATPGALPLGDHIAARLRQALPPALRAATEAAIQSLDTPPSPEPTAPAHEIPLPATDERALIAALRTAIDQGAPVTIRYQAADRPDAAPRTIRPLALDRQDERWYLRAYCTARHAERTFRVDRIQGLAGAAAQPATAAPPPQPGHGASPPTR